MGPGPDNPLGRYAFYLGWPTYMIHGTNKPAGVGLRSSHGCIRLYPEDIELLFSMVPVGTKVTVVNEPFVFGFQEDKLYLQAFDVLEDDTRDWKKAQKKLVSKSLGADIQKELKKRNEEVSWDLVASVGHDPRGIPLVISTGGTKASMKSSQPRRACRTACRKAPRGMARRTCQSTKPRTRKCSRIAIPRRRPPRVVRFRRVRPQHLPSPPRQAPDPCARL